MQRKVGPKVDIDYLGSRIVAEAKPLPATDDISILLVIVGIALVLILRSCLVVP